MGLEEIVSINSNADTESILSRAEVRRSKSRVRSYLKRCKDAIIGAASSSAHDDSCSISHEPISQRATSSWYVNELPANDETANDQLSVGESVVVETKEPNARRPTGDKIVLVLSEDDEAEDIPAIAGSSSIGFAVEVCIPLAI